jgi:hypothetical protein
MMPCPICQQEATQVNTINLLALVQSSTYRCTDCGALFRHPLPSEVDVRRYYQLRYFRHPDIIERQMASLQGDWLIKQLHKDSGMNDVRYGFIELGCGRGWLVNFMKQETSIVHATGFDLDKKSVQWGKEAFSIDLRVGTLKQALKSYSFDKDPNTVPIFGLMHVLEHLHSPIDTITSFRQLSINHYIFIEVPDAAYEGDVIELDTLSGSSMCQHFWSFSGKSLELILENAGYTIVSLSKHGKSSFWASTLDGLKILQLHHLLHHNWHEKGSVSITEAARAYSRFTFMCILTFLKNHLLRRRLSRLDLPVIRVLAKFG